MKWIDFFILKPVMSISVILLIVFAGLFGWYKLPLRLFPKIEIPIITVSIDYPGASADTMKGFVTSVVENALSGITDVNFITSTSSEGHVDIILDMEMGANSDAALTNVMQQIASVRGQLPKDIDDPVITKAASDNNPILLFAFTSLQMSTPQIVDYLNRNIKPRLESVDGVATAEVLGSQYAMRIWLNPDEMAAYNLTTTDVVNALKSQNVQSTVGTLDGSSSLNVSVNSELKDPSQFNNMIIKQEGDSIVRLRDIGNARLDSETSKINAFYGKETAVMVFIQPQPGANPLTVISGVDAILPDIKQHLPSILKINTVVNSATYIKASIYEVIKSMMEAIIIVALVIYLLLGNIKSVIIPLVALPVSLIGVCFLLLVCGYSINLLTLLAMVLAVGLVVDDAIVVMENVHRHIEQGKNVLHAASEGTKEIAIPIIAMTLTLAAIFSPMIFSGGITGKLFSEFAFSLAGAVIISGIVSLILSPMMCSQLMISSSKESGITKFIDDKFLMIKNAYLRCLETVFNNKKMILVVWLVSIMGCLYFYGSTPKELEPKEDEGMMEVIGIAPDSTTTQFLEQNSQLLNRSYHDIPEIQSYTYINGIPTEHQVLSFIRLSPWGDRELSSMQLQPLLQQQINQIPGLDSVAIVPSVLPGTDGLPIQFVIKSIGEYKSLYSVAEQLMQAARKSGLFLFVTDDLKYDQPVLQIKIDRDAASAMGVSIDAITSSLSTLLNEGKVQYFNMNDRSYEVIPQAYAGHRINPSQLGSIYIMNSSSQLVALSAFVSMKVTTEPEELNQFQKFNSVTISGVMSPKYSLSEGLDFLVNQAKQILPPSMSYDFSGNSRQFIQEGSHMLWLYLSAFIVIFIVLAMQFESFSDPLIILFGSVPMSLMAAMLPLKLGFASINIYTQIGLLTIAGLICKHGILLTRYANEARLAGVDKKQAIINAAAIRFRPIVMTTLAIMFGAFPLIVATGAGAASRFNMGIVIATGMTIGTLFTLLVLPVLYFYLSRKKIILPENNSHLIGEKNAFN
ncbi:MAG: MMPL family transporter [Legionellales bacterium]|nr:MMPL family transporter [Legionellales bacterium]